MFHDNKTRSSYPSAQVPQTLKRPGKPCKTNTARAIRLGPHPFMDKVSIVSNGQMMYGKYSDFCACYPL